MTSEKSMAYLNRARNYMGDVILSDGTKRMLKYYFKYFNIFYNNFGLEIFIYPKEEI